MLRTVALSALSSLVAGHGAMVTPLSRNAIDKFVNVNAQRCSNLTGDACENGQASFWYSQGCFIGCPTCDHASGRRQTDLCGLGFKQTLTDPKYWSVNRDAEPGSDMDIYKHNPWRAPGFAPVADACGLAGGSPSRHAGPEAGNYVKTKYAQHGDYGTQVLKALPGVKPPVYKRGGIAEVAWSVRNNHGGGYQYRLCPTPTGNFTELTEACFQKHPLEFVQDQQAIVFQNGSTMKLRPDQTTFVNKGTSPPGSTWALMPMPPTRLGPCCIPGPEDNATFCAGPQCAKTHSAHRCVTGETCTNVCSPCPESPGSDCSRCDQVNKVLPGRYKKAPQFPPPCEECQGVDWNGLVVKDVVKIPAELPAGKYILGFRYDCEATAQVWSNCADVILE